MNHRYLVVLLALSFSSNLFAGDAPPLTGFGVADWGMERNKIIAAEGTPLHVFDSDGGIAYREEVMGVDARMVYNFEKGCTGRKSSKCLFSNGYYNFYETSKELSEKLENTLTEKYGPPTSVNKETSVDPVHKIFGKGEKVIEETTYTRILGKVKIVHSYVFNLYDVTSSSNELIKAGPLGDTVFYYGPYHYEIEMNKKKAKQRGL